ncbi:MAG: 16S rRNA (cytidine(1402)-2'-O)-methyltransferase, partial [bacterium]|nr:16S rRNA (cytidine(1402)-2'-O)-methyltransferase [bacterium]
VSHPATLVFYEGPHRLIETLGDLQELFDDRPIVVARELTKLHEEFLRGTAAEILEDLKKRPAVKGECTLIVGRPPRETPKETAPSEVKAKVDELVRQGAERMHAIKTVARELGLPKRTVYSIMEDHS